MKRVWTDGNCWPNQMQTLVLRAAVLQGEGALEAWRDFCARDGMEQLDQGSFRTLPLVWHNLSRQGFQHAALPTLKGIHRQAWCETRLLLRRLAPVVAGLHRAGIPLALLKGAPLALLYYRDPGLRPMQDLDILVPDDRGLEAIAHLEAAAWTRTTCSPGTIPAEFLRFRHAIGFRHAELGEIDLHWHLSWRACFPGVDDPFWEAAVDLEFEGTPVRTLAPTDLLVHACVHGVEWNPIPPMRWATDAFAVLRGPFPIDWQRFLAMTERLSSRLVMREALEYLVRELDAPIPPDVLAKLRAHRASRAERAAHQRTVDPDRLQPPLDTLLGVYYRHASSTRDRGALRRLAAFPSFARFHWGDGWRSPSLFSGLARWVRRRLRP